MDQFGGAEHMAGRPGFQDASEYRLMKSELLLDRFRSQANLPAELALAGGDPAVNQRKLDSIRIIQRKPVKIGPREELTAGTGGPEILDRSCKIEAAVGIDSQCIRNIRPASAVPGG